MGFFVHLTWDLSIPLLFHWPRSFSGPKGQIRQVGIDVQTDKEHIKGQPRASLKEPPPKTKWSLLVGPFLLGGGWGNFNGVGRAWRMQFCRHKWFLMQLSMCPNFLHVCPESETSKNPPGNKIHVRLETETSGDLKTRKISSRFLPKCLAISSKGWVSICVRVPNF